MAVQLRDAAAAPINGKASHADLANVPLRNLLREMLRRVPEARKGDRSIYDFVGSLANVSSWRIQHAEAANPSNVEEDVMDDEGDAEAAEVQADPFVAAVRVVLSNAVCGRPHTDFPRVLNQLRLCKVSIPTKYINETFAHVVEHIALGVVRHRVCSLVNAVMPGLGIPSDIALFMDGGTIGRVFRSVRSSVLVLGATVAVPSSRDGLVCLCIDGLPLLDGRPTAVSDQIMPHGVSVAQILLDASL